MQSVFNKSKKGSAKPSQNGLGNVADTYSICFIKVSIKVTRTGNLNLKYMGIHYNKLFRSFCSLKWSSDVNISIFRNIRWSNLLQIEMNKKTRNILGMFVGRSIEFKRGRCGLFVIFFFFF